MNPNKLDKYAMGSRDPQPLFERTVPWWDTNSHQENRNVIKIRQDRYLLTYDRPPWKPVNEKQFDVKLSAFGLGTSSERYRMETARTLDEDYGKHVKIHTDGLKMRDKVRYAIVKEEPTIK
jgi:hypothetical protein